MPKIAQFDKNKIVFFHQQVESQRIHNFLTPYVHAEKKQKKKW